uniref:EF-hand domain-containing protein n=1 Tax=Neobodo designis TaxID=312471 RepID=A0A7S1W153_NEODS|mmetsp:Transcript_4872/g.15420  ORF Transcript_4872/g.15420 Transcript_4872/m.15420 type:complete len:220 (+) Transcript_4872:2-661(+)
MADQQQEQQEQHHDPEASPVLRSDTPPPPSSSARQITAPDENDPRLDKAIGIVRVMSNPHLKEQCVRTEWAATETDLERDLLVDVVSDHSFWADVKQMTTEDVEVLPADDSEVDTDERLKQMFKTFDKDNSGTIDANELHQMLLYMGVATTESEVKEMIAQVDKNGDGDIDLEEFLEVMKGAQDVSSPRAVRKASFRAKQNADDQADVRADQQRAADEQ